MAGEQSQDLTKVSSFTPEVSGVEKTPVKRRGGLSRKLGDHEKVKVPDVHSVSASWPNHHLSMGSSPAI